VTGGPGARHLWLAAGVSLLAAALLAGLGLVLLRPDAASNAAPGSDLGSSGPSPTLSAVSPPPGAATSAPPTASPSAARTSPARTTTAAAPARFATLRPGATLPSGSQCAAWVRARPYPENKGANRTFNQTQGHHISADLFSGDDARAGSRIAPRVDGAFTGTTGQILRWVACKWGIDEDYVKAQAAIESWWQQNTKGDWGTDAAACPPGHGPGADGRPGECPQSFGVLQTRYPYMKSGWPGIGSSTAMSADLAYGIWRACFEGYEGWLNTVDRGRDYAAGDAWGCMGRWFSGRWYTQPANDYLARLRDYHDRRIWETPDFQQP